MAKLAAQGFRAPWYLGTPRWNLEWYAPSTGAGGAMTPPTCEEPKGRRAANQSHRSNAYTDEAL